MKIRIISVGKKCDKYLSLGILDYCQKIQPYAQIELIELNDSSPRKEEAAEIEKCKMEEGKKILKLLKNQDYVVTLDLDKTEMNSLQFSTFLVNKLEESGSFLTFIIGGSYGLSEEVKRRANFALSLSKMTFLHQMSRLILLEQIYRAFKIYHHEVYHK